MSVQQVSEYVDVRSQQERLQTISDLRDQERGAQRLIAELDPEQVVLQPGSVHRSVDQATRQRPLDKRSSAKAYNCRSTLARGPRTRAWLYQLPVERSHFLIARTYAF